MKCSRSVLIFGTRAYPASSPSSDDVGGLFLGPRRGRRGASRRPWSRRWRRGAAPAPRRRRRVDMTPRRRRSGRERVHTSRGRRQAPMRTETAQIRETKHPRPRLMETTRPTPSTRRSRVDPNAGRGHGRRGGHEHVRRFIEERQKEKCHDLLRGRPVPPPDHCGGEN